MDTTKINAAWATTEAWCKTHPLVVQYGVCVLAGFLLAKCVF